MDRHLTLHHARVTRNLGLRDLSARTSLSPQAVRKIDEGRFNELPPGVYARAYVKAFAVEVGVDPVDALKQVEHLLPDAPDPLPVMRELKGPSLSDRLVTIVERLRKRGAPTAEAAEHCIEQTADDAQSDDPSPSRPQLKRLAAAATDAAVLIAMNGALVGLVALGTGLPAAVLLKQGKLALAGLCAVPTVLYFVLFAGIGGRTVGGWLWRVQVTAPGAPLTLDAIFRRSLTAAAAEGRQDLSRPALVGRH